MSWAPGLVTDEGRIDPAEWRAAWEGGQPVGLCDDDGGLVLVVPAGDSPVEVVGNRAWFTSRCTSCDREQTAPDGRLAPRKRKGTPMPEYVKRVLQKA